MAEVSYEQLVEAVRKQPQYLGWELGSPIEQAFYIKMGDVPENTIVESLTFDTADGRTLVLDVLPTGHVVGLEFC